MLAECVMHEWSPVNLSKIINETNFFYDDNESLAELIEYYIFPKLGVMGQQTNFFVVEPLYVETAWKDMVALHFVSTSYQIDKYVTRVHLFKDCEFTNEAYLGYFNIRSIDEVMIWISFIYPNWTNLPYLSLNQAYIMTYRKTVHFMGYTLEIETFPFFAQDGIVASCAHANVIMISKYLEQKYGMHSINLRDIYNDYSFNPIKSFPIDGMYDEQLAEVFYNNKISVKNYKYTTADSEDEFKNILDAHIESSIPVMVSIDNHVVLIIGHTSLKKDSYFIYDDSGALFHQIDEETQNIYPFCKDIKWVDIIKLIKKSEDVTLSSSMIVPNFDRVNIQYRQYNIGHLETELGFFEEYLKENKPEIFLKDFSIRNIIVDNSIFKKHILNEHVDNPTNIERVKTLISYPMPHYLWYTEMQYNVSDEKFIYVYVADPTYHFDTDYNIFYTDFIMLNKELSLLTKLPSS